MTNEEATPKSEGPHAAASCVPAAMRLPHQLRVRVWLLLSMCRGVASGEVQATPRDAAAQSLHLVIPCYNEAKRLPQDEYVAYARAHPNTQFTFVNDGSTDATLELLESLAQRLPGQLHVLSLTRNRGKAEATRFGLQTVAAAEQPAALVGFWDADLATPLDAVSNFAAILAERGHIEMVFGARVALLGRQINRLPSRHYLGRIFATLASTVLSLRIYDTQCGAKIFRNSATFRSAIAEPFDSPWIFDGAPHISS
jgi:dolichyl-phosphate beta-glucosyltransferase